MKRYMLHALCCVLSGYCDLNGMQHMQTVKKMALESIQKEHSICADVMILPEVGLKYAGYNPNLDALHDKKGEKIVLNPQDVLVAVLISKNNAEISQHVFYQSIDCLPFAWFEGKKENDVVEFLYADENEQPIYFKLTCKQLGSFAHYYGDFSSVLTDIQHKFAIDSTKLEHHHGRDRLIEDRIIERRVNYDGNIIYCHGPNGFKMKLSQPSVCGCIIN